MPPLNPIENRDENLSPPKARITASTVATANAYAVNIRSTGLSFAAIGECAAFAARGSSRHMPSIIGMYQMWFIELFSRKSICLMR